MKKQSLAFLLAALMALSVLSALAGEQPAPVEDPVLATVNGKAITKSQVAAQIPSLLENQYITDATDYRSVLERMIIDEFILSKIKNLEFDKFSEEERTAFSSEAQQFYDDLVMRYADQFQSFDSEQAREEAEKMARDQLANQGFTVEIYQEYIESNASFDRLKDYYLAGYEPSETEINNFFLQFGVNYQQQYENNISQYEYMTQYAGQSSWYTPEGYRGVIHILLKVDDTLLKNYQDLNAKFEEQQQADGVPVEDGEAAATAAPEQLVTQQMVDEARQAALDSRKADIDMIYERLQRGENFLDLIKEYGEDPGMTVEENLQNGYSVHAQSIVYDPVFTAAAFSEKMQKPGDVSDPVLGNFGIHIVQYLRDVPSGLIMTDAIHNEISDYLVNVKQNEVFGQAFETWKSQETVVYYEEAIAQAITEAAQQQVQSPEELPLEAIPGEGEEATTEDDTTQEVETLPVP